MKLPCYFVVPCNIDRGQDDREPPHVEKCGALHYTDDEDDAWSIARTRVCADHVDVAIVFMIDKYENVDLVGTWGRHRGITNLDFDGSAGHCERFVRDNARLARNEVAAEQRQEAR